MGSGNTKEINCIRPKTIFSNLEAIIESLKNNNEELKKEEFKSLEEFKNSKSKLYTEDLQQSANDELYKIRQAILKITNKCDIDLKNNKLNILEQKLQDIYMENSEIITDKIQPLH